MDNQIRTDGVYQYAAIYEHLFYKDGSPLRYEYSNYLRFYDDGLVLGVSTTDTPDGIVEWLNRDNDHGRGQYSLVSNEVQFSLTFREGAIDYSGRVEPERLVLNVHSQITGDKSTHEYTFVPVLWPY